MSGDVASGRRTGEAGRRARQQPGDGPAGPEPQPRKRPVQRRSAETVAAIVEAARRVLERRGWAAATTTEIAAVAGVSVGSLYQYFPNKGAIVAAVLADRVDAITRAAAEAPVAPEAGLAEAVRVVMERVVAEKRAGVRLSAALAPAMPAVAGRAVVARAARGLVDVLCATLAGRGRAGSSPGPLDVETAIAAVEGVLSDIATNRPERLDEPGLVPRLTAVFLAALTSGSGA